MVEPQKIMAKGYLLHIQLHPLYAEKVAVNKEVCGFTSLMDFLNSHFLFPMLKPGKNRIQSSNSKASARIQNISIYQISEDPCTIFKEKIVYAPCRSNYTTCCYVVNPKRYSKGLPGAGNIQVYTWCEEIK